MNNESENKPVETPIEKPAKRSRRKNPRQIVGGNKIGRNDQCPCGSKIKYKYCCLKRRNAYIARQNAVAEEVKELMSKTPE